MGRSMPTAGMFMIDKANAGQAGIVLVDTVKGLVMAWRYYIVVPPVLFLLESSSAGVFKGGNNVVGGEIPDVTVLS